MTMFELRNPAAKTAVAFAAAMSLAGIGAGTAVAAPSATDATVQSCYGSAVSYRAISGLWPALGGYATATKACTDVNVKTNYSRKVRVCFQATGECNGYRLAPKGQWTVAAYGVNDGAKFRLEFSGSNDGTGMVAY
ncbi:hypothetical protein [Amycolatopsis keratiniphila]|uniref:hypothetical protein n=1 Tax=Amycolatopsis keratiniphila TaxID=129921 RepID=UPI00087D3BD2|nr:hypothetical protein [Amycolatopsis keratiniphila]OLZ52687.1 hypothetical protein BS330_22575 [Amycolatopsis keratiniphila subsp. nogabecina]SDU10176.1 hypothetical protein SAMN04489733_1140 [Amycolatopsis keratiniphila]